MLLADIQKLVEVTQTHVLGTICSTLIASEGSRKATYWFGWIVENMVIERPANLYSRVLPEVVRLCSRTRGIGCQKGYLTLDSTCISANSLRKIMWNSCPFRNGGI